MIALGASRRSTLEPGEEAALPAVAGEGLSQRSAAALCDAIVAEIGVVILGKEATVRSVLTALLAGGHVLLEDLPGMGKTTLAHAFAKILGLSFQRIQFTADLLPADVLGVSVFNQTNASFEFHPGPIFANVVLADEVNRATPKTQSALLEAMEEHQVTQDRVTRALPAPFFVLATQNPSHQVGTFALPESQLDRFVMRLQIGYPDAQSERALLRGQDRRSLLRETQTVTGPNQIAELQRLVRDVHVSDALLDYLQALIAFTRHSNHFTCGLSPRAGLSLLGAARAWAFIAHRDHIVPEDLQAVLPGVVGHRLRLSTDTQVRDASSCDEVVGLLLKNVDIP
ncbi:MAG: MoxR-like ATPase [Gammaproteobacteria bacterium]|jgi:MoxR-like ATPase